MTSAGLSYALGSPAMPRDDWAKARAKDKAKQAEPAKLRGKRRSKWRKAGCSWLEAIQRARTNADLSAVARTIQVVHGAGRMSDYRYCVLLEAGRRKRSALKNSQ